LTVNFVVSATAMTAITPALDTWVGYNPHLESEILPQVEDLVREAEALLGW
jgi:hypothetical protein